MSAHSPSPPAKQTTLGESITDEIVDGELAADLPLPDESPLVRYSGYVRLRWCPVCRSPLSSVDSREPHFARHTPEDFGLAPIGEGRRQSTSEIFDGEEPPFETGGSALPWEVSDD